MNHQEGKNQYKSKAQEHFIREGMAYNAGLTRYIFF